MVIQKNKLPLILKMEYGNISKTQLKSIYNGYISLLEIYCDSVYISWNNQIKLVFLLNHVTVVENIEFSVVQIFNVLSEKLSEQILT